MINIGPSPTDPDDRPVDVAVVGMEAMRSDGKIVIARISVIEMYGPHSREEDKSRHSRSGWFNTTVEGYNLIRSLMADKKKMVVYDKKVNWSYAEEYSPRYDRHW